MPDTATVTPTSTDASVVETQQTETTQQEQAKVTDKTVDATGQPDKLWHESYEDLGDDDRKILAKYKTIEDAVRSIPHRERKLSDLKLDFPPDDAEPEVREKSHRSILRRMGAPKKIEVYQQIAEAAVKEFPDAVREFLPDGYIQSCCEEGLELHQLPWQFEKALAMSLSHVEATVNARRDRREKSEKEMKRIYGHHMAETKGEAEKLADAFDGDLFRQDNLQLPPQERQEKGGLLKRLLVESQNPVLYRFFAHLHDKLLSEGDGSIAGSAANRGSDGYTRAYEAAKANNPKRPELWDKMAKEATGGGR